MINKLLDLLTMLFSFLFSKPERKKIELREVAAQKKQEAIFKSDIEKIAKNAESSDPVLKQDAVDKMRKLISEK